MRRLLAVFVVASMFLMFGTAAHAQDHVNTDPIPIPDPLPEDTLTLAIVALVQAGDRVEEAFTEIESSLDPPQPVAELVAAAAQAIKDAINILESMLELPGGDPSDPITPVETS